MICENWIEWFLSEPLKRERTEAEERKNSHKSRAVRVRRLAEFRKRTGLPQPHHEDAIYPSKLASTADDPMHNFYQGYRAKGQALCWRDYLISHGITTRAKAWEWIAADRRAKREKETAEAAREAKS